MKILTLNTHSLLEENYEEKLKQFARVVEAELPVVFALQEVNQSIAAKKAERPKGCKPCGESGIKADNHAYRLAELLRADGIDYEWVWIGAKVGYGKYDEGMAVFSRTPILDTAEFYISRIQDYRNWRTRKVLGIKTGIVPAWYFSVHMGWWDDEEEPFSCQWDSLCKQVKQVVDPETRCYIMGDFNSPAQIPGEGYALVGASGWYDTWQMAERKDSGVTVGKVIDGWKGRLSQEEADDGIRIDYIWCNEKVAVKSSQVVCNGTNYPVVSDHYGVMIEVDENGELE